MTTLVLGIGLGLFVVLSLWIAAAVIFFVSWRIEKKIGIVALASVLIVTIVLLSFPRTSEQQFASERKPHDRLFYWRVILLILLGSSSIIGLYGYVKFNLTEPARPLRVTSWVL